MADSRTEGLHVLLPVSIWPSCITRMYLIQLLLLSAGFPFELAYLKFIVQVHISGRTKQASMHTLVWNTVLLAWNWLRLASNMQEIGYIERGTEDTQAHLGLQTVLLSGWLRELNQWWCRCRPRDPSVEFGETGRHCATYPHLSMSGKEGKRRVSERFSFSLMCLVKDEH